VDIVATVRDPLGFRRVGVVECKKYSKDRLVDAEAIRQVSAYAGALHAEGQADWTAIVTTAFFSEEALDLGARSTFPLQLVDRAKLLEWILEARAEEERRAGSLAFQVERLDLRELGRVAEFDPAILSTSEVLTKLRLPTHYQERLVRVDQVPFQVLQTIISDPRHLHGLTPRQFEEFVAELVEGLGFKNVILTPVSGDGGRDVIASKLVHDIPITFYFECKKYAEGNKVQLATLRSLLGVVAHHATEANIGVLVTTSTFTRGCRELIASECRLDGKDYQGIMEWVREYKGSYPPV
jgi:restriction endonuclease Mrr